MLAAMEREMKRREIQAALGLRHEDHFREAYLLPALELEGIEMTLPDKPRSSQQRYRITSRGEEFLKKHREDDN
ncbi:MAG: Fic family protein [Thermoanaerobaculia bacterium]